MRTAEDFRIAAREIGLDMTAEIPADTRAAYTGPSWPEPLAPEAFHCPLGDWVRLIEPHT